MQTINKVNLLKRSNSSQPSYLSIRKENELMNDK